MGSMCDGPAFDFDEWLDLANTDPAGFERRRQEWIEAAIQSAPPKHHRRLRGLQFRIDMERTRARTPMAACLRVADLMWDSLLGPRGLQPALKSLLAVLGGTETVPSRPLPVQSARILPYPKITPDPDARLGEH